MKKILCTLAALALLSSCSNSDDSSNTPTDGTYTNGVIILNEGGFTKNNASVSFISNDLNTVKNDIYTTSNQVALGDVAQSHFLYNDKIFIVVNNSNVIEIVDRVTFKKVGEITEQLAQPRYMTVANNKIYVTNAINSKITVYNAQTYAYLKTISLNYMPEKIVSNQNYVYVQSSGWGDQKTVESFSLNDESLAKTFNFTYSSKGIALDKATGNVFTISSGDDVTRLTKINGQTNTIEKEISSTTQKKGNHLAIDNGYIYYTAGTGVYRTSLVFESLPSAPLFNVEENSFSTLYGFNVLNNKIFTSDAKGFVANSEVSIYSTTGQLMKKITTQIGTNGFIQN